jgi:hypothetical protein
MGAIGTLTVYDDDGTSTLDTFDFYNINFPGHGFPEVDGVNQIEPINAMGVNFTRRRVVRIDAPQFPAIIHCDFDSFDDAVTQAQICRTYKGHLCSITYTANAVEYALNQLFEIIEATAIPAAGEVVSSNQVSTDAKAIITLILALQYTGIDLS